ncbi:E3 ubiquitin-protein ligase MYLIP [Pectinophora gossypiella]|uniref:E3 ubiquitin-protein ligase MYLIP n=1 Tax=Pectinophora gossypiella TaxID=13191 RepID=UPI00214E6B2E|nr:E3 ubiquitin-protein ligase MYLIP [Pectinophora gossypiella]
MWLVSQPNSVILEVKVDPNAIGQECLEKVCEKLEIGAEADYFGLRVCPGSGPGRWLNLRNPLDPHRIPGGRLDLRVKFWVPPHLLINEPTRHQFYLHAKLDLTEGRLVVADIEVARRIIAYIAQAETGDCDPDLPPVNIYDECDRIGPQGEKPEDHIEKIIDYHCEIAGMRASQAEYRLLKEISKLESFGEELFFCKPVTLSNNAHNLYSHLQYHRQQVEEPRARDEQEIDGGATVGCLTSGQNVGGCGCRLSTCVGVGPHGIVVYRPACNGEQDIGVEKQSIPYTAIHRAQPLRRIFQLSYVTGEGHEATLHVKMATSGQAAALYRAVTEKHAFYCCETVRSDVTEQFIRDLKGTIASIFNDSTTLGRRYVFDIRRTCRELHDRARRAAHAHAAAAHAHEPRARRGSRGGGDHDEPRSRSRSGGDALACRVCMDQPMDTLFLPCRHVVCCEHCAPRCERCPLCRGEIEKLMHIFLPVEYQKTTGVIVK